MRRIRTLALLTALLLLFLNSAAHAYVFPTGIPAPDFGPGAAVFQGWRCTLNSKVGYEGETYNTVFTLAENNRAHAKCTFEGQFSRGQR